MNNRAQRGYDVRSIANLVLDTAASLNLEVSNLHLNKTLYFLQVEYLRDFGRPLTSAKIEAWQYGPVFREIYNQFKFYKSGAIRDFATRVDYETGERVEARDRLLDEVKDYVSERASFYLRVPPALLVDLSHAEGGAWDFVWNHSGNVNAGMEITEEIIRRFELPKHERITFEC